MKAWVSSAIAPLIINFAYDPCSALVEMNSQVHTPADLTIERPYWVPSSRDYGATYASICASQHRLSVS